MRSIVTKIFLLALFGWSLAAQARADDFEEFRRMKTGWRQIWRDPADSRNSRSLCKDHPKSLQCKAETMLACKLRELPELCQKVAEKDAIPHFGNIPMIEPAGDYLEYHFGSHHVNSRADAAKNPEFPLWAKGVANINIIFASCLKGKVCRHKELYGDTYYLHRVSGEWMILEFLNIVDMSDTVLP